jgi:CO/xanthine dehydrogenase Mo-binding subunit
MPLETTEEPYTMAQSKEDERQKNPRWTPCFTSGMSTSNSASYFGHATREAARALVDLAIWPAARSLWPRGVGGGQLAPESVRRDELRLAQGMVNGAGMQRRQNVR